MYKKAQPTETELLLLWFVAYEILEGLGWAACAFGLKE